MDSTSITNYDVLVEPPTPGKSGDYQFTKHKSHVGNNRLQVFLNLYQSAYNGALQRGAFSECNGIVDTIVSTVCHQCVPRGRFLLSSMVAVGDGNDVVLWNQVNEDSAKTLLHEVLQPAKPAMNFGAFPPKPGIDLGVFPCKVDDGAQKRRRRSSLLRRSASESMLGMVLDNKKKLSRVDQFQLQGREDPTWKSAGHVGDGEIGILTLNRMDIILTPARNALDPNSVSIGNNRLHILVAMQSSKYQQASIDRQEAILREVVQTVHTFWKGRFLVDGPDGHEELDWEEAINALRSIFDMRSGQQLPKRLSLPAERGTSEMPRQPRPAGLHRQASVPMLLSTSMSMIPSGASIDLPDVSRLRSAAVKSLQKQKARQTIANRLEGKMPRNGSGENQVQQNNHVPQQNSQMAQNQYVQNQLQQHPFQACAAHGAGMPRKRESTVLGKLDATVMEQLVEDFDDADCNESDDAEPLPPTNSNKFGSQFSGSGRDPFL
jgi:hypothetical protein